jgi:exonuclease V gamma subunit
MKVFVSNKLTELSEMLRQALFCGSHHPLKKRWVIVPSEEVKLDLYLQWIESSEVVAGIKTITYCELIRKIFPEIPCKTELALRIETALDSVEELKDYVEKNVITKIELSAELSSLFLKYLQRPAHELLEWLEIKGWQQALWKEIFGRTLPTATVRPLEGNCFFYHPSHIHSHEWEAFSQMDTTWFLFSPSAMFTGDLLTEWQQKFLLRKAQSAVKRDLFEYFQQDSPLLSNWITRGQQLLRYFESAETIECFKEPETPLQREWLTLERGVSCNDSSIELHSAPSMLREVELVWDILQTLPYAPREILILTPDIMSYAAPIEWVFKQRGGLFDYSIMGIHACTHSPLLQGLQLLLLLPTYRFSCDFFKKLLLCTPFLNRWGLSIEEGKLLNDWMCQMHLRYDMTGHVGSWHATLKRVIEALAKTGEFDFSDAPLINSWIEITLNLEKELAPLLDGEKRSGAEWASLIESWMETFFKSNEEFDILKPLLSVLRSEKITGLFPYDTIQYHLQSAFTNPSGSMQRSNLNAVRFTSFTTGAVSPAKIIICMGMQEGTFPRFNPPSSLPQLPISNRIIEDQYLFLEAVCHAEKKLILTYQRFHPEDGKEIQPSSLIQELAKDRGSLVTTHHLLTSPQPVSIIPRQKGVATSTLKKVIDIRILRKLARHPVQCFLEEGLGLRFPFQEKDSEFLFSPLEMHQLRKKALKKTTKELIDELDSEGKLPVGSFKTAALQSIEQEVEGYKNSLAQMGIDPLTVFSLELSPHAQKFIQVADDWHVAPPLKIKLPSGGFIQLQGVIEGITPQGLLFHGSESTEDLLKAWPLYVTLQAVLGPTSLLLTKKEVMTEIPLLNPLETLERYVGYLEKNLQTPSPLLPAWGRRILKGDPLPPITDDPILLWARERNILPTSEEWAEWSPYLQEVVRELL